MLTIIYERLSRLNKAKKLKVLVVESMVHPQIRTELNELKKHANVDLVRIERGKGVVTVLSTFLKNVNFVVIGFLRLRSPPIPCLTYLLSLLLSAQIIKLDKIHAYTVFYAHWLFPAGISALIAGRAMGKKTINVAWGYDIQVSSSDSKYGIRKPFQTMMTKITVKHSDILVVNHEVHKQIALELVRKDCDSRIRYFLPPVDLEKFVLEKLDTKQMKRALGLPASSYVVLFSPHLMRLYGVLDLLEAIPMVVHRVDNAYFVLVGDGGLRRYIAKTLKEKDLSQKVLILGKVNPEKMPQIYAIADVVCDLCYAGQGTTTLEALASGTPIIGMRSRKRLVRDGYSGYLVSPNNPVELAEKITKILTNPELKAKMRLNAHLHAQTFCSKKKSRNSHKKHCRNNYDKQKC